MTHLIRNLLALSILVIGSHLASGAPTDKATKQTLEARSPDGQFAFRSTGESDAEKRTYDLIDTASGKALLTVAQLDADPGPSARFSMDVLWRPDSKAFALKATLWKRGSEVRVYARDRGAFHEIKLPELTAEIPDKVKEGKPFPHVSESNSRSPKRWQKDGSLVVEIETVVDGNNRTLTATRTVVLGFDHPGPATIAKSTTKYDVQVDLDAEAKDAWDSGDFDTAIAMFNRALELDRRDAIAWYHRGLAYYLKRDWPKALADFQRHCELRKAEPNQLIQARFYLWLLHTRLGDPAAADKALAPYMEGHPPEWSRGWDAKIANFLLGKTSEEDFLAALSDNPGAAWFYAGMKRLLHHDPEAAATAFKKSVATADKATDEYQLATAELKALTK